MIKSILVIKFLIISISFFLFHSVHANGMELNHTCKDLNSNYKNLSISEDLKSAKVDNLEFTITSDSKGTLVGPSIEETQFIRFTKKSLELISFDGSWVGDCKPATVVIANKKCPIDPSACADDRLCRMATMETGGRKSWVEMSGYKNLVLEAEKRGLSCGVLTDDQLVENETNNLIEKLQVLLSNAGFYNGKKDGVYDINTESSINEAFLSTGYKFDGNIDKDTLNFLLLQLNKKGSVFSKKRFQSSTDRIADNFCKFIEKNAIRNNDSFLKLDTNDIFPINYDPLDFFRPDATTERSDGTSVKIIDIHKNANLTFSKGIIADVGGDGIWDRLIHIKSFRAPQVKLPVFIWPIGVNENLNKNKFGYGTNFGIEVEELNTDKILPVDLNGDMKTDFVITDYGEHDYDNYRNLMGGSIVVALSQGNSNYKVSKLQGPNNLWHHAVTVDFDEDGDMDVIAIGGSPPDKNSNINLNQLAGFTHLFLNDGFGNFNHKPLKFVDAYNTRSVGASNLFGDSMDEIVFGKAPSKSNSKGAMISIVSNQKIIERYKLKNYGKWAIWDIFFHDVDKDGNKDIVLVLSDYNFNSESTLGSNVLHALLMNNGKVFKERTIFDGKTYPFGRGLFGNVISCGEDIIVLNQTRTSFWNLKY